MAQPPPLDAAAPPHERAVAVNQLCASLAACESAAAASDLARSLCTAQTVDVLLSMLVDGEPLAEMSLVLLTGMCVHADGRALVVRCRVLPVLLAAMRAEDRLLREHGMRLLVILADDQTSCRAMLHAGVVGMLLCVGRSERASTWRHILAVVAGLLRVRAGMRAVQRQQLDQLLSGKLAALGAGGGDVGALEAADEKRLRTLLAELRVGSGGEPVKSLRAA